MCSICGNENNDINDWIMSCTFTYDDNTNKYTSVLKTNADSRWRHENCAQILDLDNNNLIYAANYILKQLNTGKVPK